MPDSPDPIPALIARANDLSSREFDLREILMDLVEHLQVVVDLGAHGAEELTEALAALDEAESCLASGDRTAALVCCEKAEARVRGLRAQVEPGWN